MSFSDKVIQEVWEKGTIVPGYDAEIFRKDQCGAWMVNTDYGFLKSEYGWEVDYIKPPRHGGSDDLSNLRPLHWQNNLSKSYGRLVCVVTAQGNENIQK